MTLNIVADSLGWTLLHFLWQGALIAAVTAPALHLLRKANPVARYNLACGALLACLLWPAAELYLRLTDHASAGAPVRITAAILMGKAGGATGGMLSYLQNHLLWIVGLWALCTLSMALRMVLGLAWVRSTAHVQNVDAQLQASVSRLAQQFGIARQVRLRVVDKLASPVTAGWLRPLILVPAALVSGMPPELLEALLAHEMAHVRRLDYLVNLGQNVIEMLLFYHPAVWWISGRIRAEREQIADDLAAQYTGQPRTLALALSELEKLQFGGHHLAMAANGGDLVARVRRLVRPDAQALGWKAAIPIFGMAAACLSMLVHATTSPVIPPSAFAVRPPIADFRSCAKPEYPATDITAAHEGTVTLSFDVGVYGQVVGAAVEKSSGYPSMDNAAMEAMKLCHFSPAMQNGKPIAASVNVQYVWTLQ